MVKNPPSMVARPINACFIGKSMGKKEPVPETGSGKIKR
jgi:hypothetical protein